MKTVPLRQLAELNPQSPRVDSRSPAEEVLFLPLEAVWSDARADQSRTALKGDVESGYTRFHAGDVVVPKVSPTFAAGRSMIAADDGVGTTELHVLRARAGVDPRWVRYAVRSKHFLEEGVSAYEGVAGLRRVPPDFVNSFRVADRGAEEQRRIADFLDDRVARIDQIIATRREQISRVEQLLAAQISESFAEHSTERVQVKRLLREPPAYGLVPDEVGTDPSWPRYIRTTDIGPRGTLDPETFASVSPAYLADYSLVEGDVLVARSGSVGKSLVVRGDAAGRAVFAGYLIRLRFGPIDPRAFWYFTRTSDFMDQISANAVQSTILNFNAERYGSLWMPDIRHSSAALSQRLDAFTDDVHASTDSLRASIDLLTEYKQSLITAAVTGELDVTTAGSGIPG